jgi:hypothetical protein
LPFACTEGGAGGKPISMSYAYPDALPEVVEQRWAAADLGGLVTAPLPTREQMLGLIHPAFQASLLSEEGRPVAFRLVLCEPDELSEDVELRSRNRALRFAETRPLSVAEIVRLAPAADPSQTLIGVRDDGGNPVIWGLIDAGLSWWEYVRGERGDRQSSSPPPERFTVSSARRGAITISRGGRVVCALNRGEITVPTATEQPGLFLDFIGLHPRAIRGVLAANEVFTRGPFGAFLRPVADALHADVLEQLGADRYGEPGDDDYPRQFILQLVERILIRVRDAGHGGTLLLVPDAWRHGDSRLFDRVAIKYPADDADTWPTLLRALRAHREYDGLLLPAWDKPTVSQAELHRLLFLEEELTEASDLVRDRANLIASLAKVDGAVVLTDRLRLLGFGAEIIAQSPTLHDVVLAQDATAREVRRRPIEDFGTRHRSAFRFCSSHDQVAALVVSQDGDVRAMLRIGPDIVIWPSVAATTRV